MLLCLPAAKCSGVDLRLPAVSLAFTVCDVINFLTFTVSPDLQASNSSRNGSFVNDGSKLTDSSVLLRVAIMIAKLNGRYHTN